MSKSSPGNSYPEHVAAASKFADDHPGKLPSEVYANGDDYQRMTDGWISCMVVIALPVLVLVGGVVLVAAI